MHPPGPGCPWCGGAELTWHTLGTDITGTVYSYIVVHRAFLRSFVDDVPYIVALVDVDGVPGVHITGNVLGVDPDEISIGMRVRMFWEERAPGRGVPQWQTA